jgi:two-component system, NarL family, sensor histidine kinase UhpB
VHVLRGFAGQLRPPTLKNYGLEKTIRSHADQFQEDHPEITLTLDLMSDGNKLPERVSLALFRIYQQSLANILRHAHATCVNIRLILDDQHVQLGIEDNGDGFEVPPRLVDLIHAGHYGLVGSAERAEAIGGTLTIDSQPGRGTTIFVNVNVTMTPL